MDSFDSFVDRIRTRLKKKGYSKKKLNSIIDRLIRRYEDCSFFKDSLQDPDPDFDDSYEFCDAIKDCPNVVEETDNTLPFLVLKRTHNQVVNLRIRNLKSYYELLQREIGEDWFPFEDCGVEPYDVRGEFGRTPIIAAIIDDNINQVQRLIIQGADPYITDNNGDNALEAAKKNDRHEIVEFLREIMG